MKTILLCDQKTSEVQKMNINNTNELQYTISKPYTYESLIGVHQPCKDQLEEAGKSLRMFNTPNVSGANDENIIEVHQPCRC